MCWARNSRPEGPGFVIGFHIVNRVLWPFPPGNHKLVAAGGKRPPRTPHHQPQIMGTLSQDRPTYAESGEVRARPAVSTLDPISRGPMPLPETTNAPSRFDCLVYVRATKPPTGIFSARWREHKLSVHFDGRPKKFRRGATFGVSNRATILSRPPNTITLSNWTPPSP